MSVPRSFARSCAAQALYQMLVGGQGAREIERQFLEERGLGRADPEHFKALLHGVFAHAAQLDQRIGAFTHIPVDELDPVERAILRLGTFELLFHAETPYRVVINECVNLAKRFGATDGHKYINGILDKIARQERSTEVGMVSRSRPSSSQEEEQG